MNTTCITHYDTTTTTATSTTTTTITTTTLSHPTKGFGRVFTTLRRSVSGWVREGMALFRGTMRLGAGVPEPDPRPATQRRRGRVFDG
ncbi:hypothetical protein E2C01_046494 [Portunus trituberculatus]|uniref:Uncharacterized protein n=1 Tax=Portunus trituberculatus TaxID=210409 RepID=A0A5B7FYR9_PORTR|nr:hypothetical protein [Portunus trituberculatus]